MINLIKLKVITENWQHDIIKKAQSKYNGLGKWDFKVNCMVNSKRENSVHFKIIPPLSLWNSKLFCPLSFSVVWD